MNVTGVLSNCVKVLYVVSMLSSEPVLKRCPNGGSVNWLTANAGWLITSVGKVFFTVGGRLFVSLLSCLFEW